MFVAVLAAGCGSTRSVVVTVTVASLPTAAAPPADQTIYGRPSSIQLAGGRTILHFDPAFMTSGITANAAAAVAQGLKCKPTSCPPVPNDYFVADAAHEDLVFVLPASSSGTVLARRGASGNAFPPTRIDGAQLATIVSEGKAPGITLFEPLDSGLWLRLHGDTIRSFAQQYRP